MTNIILVLTWTGTLLNYRHIHVSACLRVHVPTCSHPRATAIQLPRHPPQSRWRSMHVLTYPHVNVSPRERAHWLDVPEIHTWGSAWEYKKDQSKAISNMYIQYMFYTLASMRGRSKGPSHDCLPLVRSRESIINNKKLWWLKDIWYNLNTC